MPQLYSGQETHILLENSSKIVVANAPQMSNKHDEKTTDHFINQSDYIPKA